MRGPINPPLEVGDRIILYHMDGEFSVPPGTTGTVTKLSRDPFEMDDEKLINVKWDNGSTLALVSSVDRWKKIPKETIEEQDKSWEYMTKNPEIFENFDWKFLREFLYKIRESGIVNMFGTAPLLYSGKNHIERYYGEGREDDETFQEVLDMAEESKHKIIQGVVKFMEKNNLGLDDMNSVNRYASKFSDKILGLYFAMSGFKNQL